MIDLASTRSSSSHGDCGRERRWTPSSLEDTIPPLLDLFRLLFSGMVPAALLMIRTGALLHSLHDVIYEYEYPFSFVESRGRLLQPREIDRVGLVRPLLAH